MRALLRALAGTLASPLFADVSKGTYDGIGRRTGQVTHVFIGQGHLGKVVVGIEESPFELIS